MKPVECAHQSALIKEEARCLAEFIRYFIGKLKDIVSNGNN